MKITVLGTGIVGQTLAAKLDTLGFDVRIGTRAPAATLARREPGQYGNPSFSEIPPARCVELLQTHTIGRVGPITAEQLDRTCPDC